MPAASNGVKVCNKCKCAKPVDEFHKHKATKDGLMGICIKCKREYRISPFYKAREKELEKTQQYKERKKRYKQTDNGAFHKSRDSHIERSKKLNNHNRNDLLFIEWECILINQGNRCAICGCNFTDINKPVRDCIIPISKGGVLTFSNTQALCDHCNSSKNKKMYSGLGNRWRSKYNSNAVM